MIGKLSLKPILRSSEQCKRSCITRAVLFSVVPLVLGACSDPKANISRMNDEIKVTLAASDEQTTSLERESSAVDLLAGFVPAVRAAVTSDPGYRAALQFEFQATNEIGVDESVRRPQLTGTANVGKVIETGANSSSKTYSGMAGGLVLSQVIYDGGESAAAINKATAVAVSASAGREVSGNDLALQAARAWIDLWQARARLDNLTSRTHEIDALIVQMERMAADGFLDRSGLDSVRRQMTDIEMERIRRESDLDEAGIRFRHFYNVVPKFVKIPTDLITSKEAKIAAAAWQNSPAILRIASEVLVARSELKAAEAAFKPRARLQAGLNTPIKTSDRNTKSLGIVVQYTFGDGGRRRAQLAASKANLNASEARLEDSKRQLRVELSTSISRLDSIEENIPLIEQKLAIGTREATTVRSQISTGQSSVRQLIELEIENYRAGDAKLSVAAERLALLMTIASRTGELGRLIGLEKSDLP